MLKNENSGQQNIFNIRGSIFANTGNINTGNIGNINFDNPSKDAMYQQEIYRLQSENDILRKSNEMLEREIVSFKSILDQHRDSQVMVKELYERKIEDLKENITLLKNLLSKE